MAFTLRSFRYFSRESESGGVDIIDSHTGHVVRTVKTKSAARQVLASMNAKAGGFFHASSLLKRTNRRNRGYVVGGSHWVSDSPYAKRLAKDWAESTQRPVKVQKVDERGDFGPVVYTAHPKPKRNPPGRSFEAKAVRAIRKGEKFLVSLPAKFRGRGKR